MSTQRTPLGRLHFGRDGLAASLLEEQLPLEPYLAVILEVFAHHHESEDAYLAYMLLTEPRPSVETKFSESIVLGEQNTELLIVGQRILICSPQNADEAYRLANLANKWSYVRGAPTLAFTNELMRKARIVDLTDFSRSTCTVVDTLAKSYGLPHSPYPSFTAGRFRQEADWLSARGLLTVPTFQMDFGDFRRHVPVCPSFGYTRGTPVDRFYLEQFVDDIRSQVVGVTLEIGGRPGNRELYEFWGATEYYTMDADPRAGADLIADAHDRSACKQESLDCVILFNVLEHCARPWDVVENVHHWLKKGGTVFCMVPNIQRIHRDPRDYWRILPDALQGLFDRFMTRVITYGSLLTSIAALSGVATEELTLAELGQVNPQYPVVSCVVAIKQ